jgi:hypothetical protein
MHHTKIIVKTLLMVGFCATLLSACGRSDILGDSNGQTECNWPLKEAGFCADLVWKTPIEPEVSMRGQIRMRALQGNSGRTVAARGHLKVYSVMQCCGTKIEAEVLDLGDGSFEVIGNLFKSPGNWAVYVEWYDETDRLVSKINRMYEIR